MSEQKIKPALTAREWEYPRIADPDYKEEFWGTPHAIAARCLYGQAFGFTRTDVKLLRRRSEEIRRSAGDEADTWDVPRSAMRKTAVAYDSLADRIEALLPPETPSVVLEEQTDR